MLALIHEVFSHSAACVRRDVLQRCYIRCCSGNDDGVIHSLVVAQSLHELCYCGLLLTYSYIDTDNILSLLVNDSIDSDSCFTCLPVSDDQLTLSLTDRYNGVDCLDTCL